MRKKNRREVAAPRTSEETPVRLALRENSPLRARVRDGLQALERSHRDYIDAKIREQFSDGLDVDAAMAEAYPEENRWDYLLGHAGSGRVIAVEPHSARSDQVSVVIAKRDKTLNHLRGHLRPGKKISEWIWVASGRVDFSPFERTLRRLDDAGIRFVGGQVKAKDLAGLGDAVEKK